MLCFISPPPSIFIGESHGRGGRLVQLILCRLTYSSNGEPPRGRFKVVGPTGPSADQAGRPTTQWGQPTSVFFYWADLLAHLALARGMASGMSVSCSGGPSNPCFDTCRVLICWNVVSWIIPHHYAAKLAQNHLHTF